MTDQPSFTCPDCGMRSFNPNDIREGYCGNCHRWTGAALIEVGPSKRFIQPIAEEDWAPFEPAGWHIGGPVIPPCNVCGMPGDVGCLPNCENKDFRDAEIEGILEQSEGD